MTSNRARTTSKMKPASKNVPQNGNAQLVADKVNLIKPNKRQAVICAPDRSTLFTVLLVLLVAFVAVATALHIGSGGGPDAAHSKQIIARRQGAIKPAAATSSTPAATKQQQQASGARADHDHGPQSRASTETPALEKRAFAIELLRMLHEQHAHNEHRQQEYKMEDRQSAASLNVPGIGQLIEALGADGDLKRLVDWARNSFNLASVGEVTTQFVVSKLGSVNCPAILKPDKEETLVPRFLLFNEHYVDVPFELSINPTPGECLTNAKFDPYRKTLVLVHGYLTGYTLVDGVTNIKNRALDLNQLANERALHAFQAAESMAQFVTRHRHHHNNGTGYVFTEDFDTKIRSQLYNVIIVDWFSGANPSPRANYIRAAVNAQVVGKLIARFLSALVVQCGTPAGHLQLVGHSLGCHVCGFAGKAMNAAGHRLGRVTHLDPVGLCFGRLFSRPQFRLSPDDALDTQAVHTSLNIFDNPLDGVHNNFLVNGGRDQPGCAGPSTELKNSTTSSVALLFDPAAKFSPCSHIRALSLLEDDHSSEPNRQCQFVGYRCASYERFLAGKCGHCDATNSQCRLMGLAPLRLSFQKSSLANMPMPASLLYSHRAPSPVPLSPDFNHHLANLPLGSLDLYSGASSKSAVAIVPLHSSNAHTSELALSQHKIHHMANSTNNIQEIKQKASSSQAEHKSPEIKQAHAAPGLPEDMYGAPAYIVGQISARADRRLAIDQQGARLAQALGKLRADTRSVLADSLRGLRSAAHELVEPASGVGPEYSVPSDGEQDEDGDNNHNNDDQQASELAHLRPMTTTSTTMNAATLTSSNTTLSAPTAATSTTSLPATPTAQAPPTTIQQQQHAGGSGQHHNATDEMLSQRAHADPLDAIPIGGQQIPSGSLNMPLFYMGTSGVSPYCVNYYQLRILIAESRLERVLRQQGLASNRLAPQLSQQANGAGSLIATAASGFAASMQHRAQTASGRDMLHLTVKLTDATGHFFRGFSLLEHSRALPRVPNELANSAPPAHRVPGFAAPLPNAGGEPLIEITMLLNSTALQEPIKVGESIISYYFHPIVLADRIEVNYMSNISPDIRAKYSSLLCPVAINDRHQLVRYIECHKVTTTAAAVAAASAPNK